MKSGCIFNKTSVKVITANISELPKKTPLSNALLIIWSIEIKTIAIAVSTKDGSLAKTMVKQLIQKEKHIPS